MFRTFLCPTVSVSTLLLSTLAIASGVAPAVLAQDRVYETTVPEISVRYYGETDCAHCDVFETITVPRLEGEFDIAITVESFDIFRPDVRRDVADLLESLGQEYRIFPVLVIGNNAYQGNRAIEENFPRELEHIVETGEFLRARPTSVTEPDPGREVPPETPAGPVETPVFRYFWAEGCPACARAAPFVDEIETRFPEIRVERYEVSGDRRNLLLYVETAARHGIQAGSVPAFFLGDRHWIGFNATIENTIRATIADTANTRARTATTVSQPDGPLAITLPVIGRVDVDTLPAFVVTAAIAFVDGFNPCSLWVLTFLIGLIVRTGSRVRTIGVGLVFLVVTAGVYGLFMLGVFTVLGRVAGLFAVRMVVAFLAVSMGLINTKDYFAFKRGPSLTISDRFHAPIARLGRSIFEKSGSPVAVVLVTTVFAFGIAVVELPCTAGFPVVWAQYVASIGASGATFLTLFALYLLVYLSIEIIVVAVAVVSMNRVAFGERRARLIKLVGGTVMIALGLAYLLFPDATHTMGGVALVFAAAAAAAAAIHLVFRRSIV